jgi:hypothetical protein
MKWMNLFSVLVMLTVSVTGCSTSGPASDDSAAAQTPTRGPLEGAWKITEVTATGGPDAGTNSMPQPSLYIFGKVHYSIMRINGTEPRARWKESVLRAEQTDAALRAAILPLIGNAGSYSVSGTTLTTRPTVAVDPNLTQDGTPGTLEFRSEGDALWLTQKSTTEPSVETTWKLMRLE